MNLDDCSRRIEDIPDQELKDLIGKQRENQHIDFKLKYDRRDPKNQEQYKWEICKDVTAMANSGGGYILIGVRETNEVAQDFCTVRGFAAIVKSISGVCRHRIDSPIQDFEVEEPSFKWDDKDITLVILHIPPSDYIPHGFRSQGSINFVKRYGADTREYPMTDLGRDLSARHVPPIIHEINEKLDTINRNILQIGER